LNRACAETNGVYPCVKYRRQHPTIEKLYVSPANSLSKCMVMNLPLWNRITRKCKRIKLHWECYRGNIITGNTLMFGNVITTCAITPVVHTQRNVHKATSARCEQTTNLVLMMMSVVLVFS
jgi:hypothetical protein